MLKIHETWKGRLKTSSWFWSFYIENFYWFYWILDDIYKNIEESNLNKKRKILTVFDMIFFSIRIFFHGHWRLTGKQGKETIFYSTLPLPPAQEHSDIYLQLCMWDDCHVFLIATLVFTRLLLDEMYHLIELPFDWLMMLH